MSDTSQKLAFQRYEALNQLNQFHKDEWHDLCEKHSIESKALETNISQVHDVFIAMYENRITSLEMTLERFEDPAMSRGISLDKQLDHWNTGLANNQELLRNTKNEQRLQTKTLVACQQNELDKVSAKHVMQSQAIENSNNPLHDVKQFVVKQEQESIDTSNEIPASPFDKIENYKDLAKNDFNEMATPYTKEQSTDMER